MHELRSGVQKSPQHEGDPPLRVFLLGPFHLEASHDDEELAWDRRTSARSLFKLLLCTPHRQATRKRLASLLWPGTAEAKALESLRTALKVLRQVFQSFSQESLLGTDSTAIWLAPQSRLWVDVDAFEDLVRQARTSAALEETTALWLAAHDLVRGEFLIGESTSDWITSSWVRQRRETFLAARRQMIYQFVDHLVHNGDEAQAEGVLHTHVSHFPTDQDAVVRLMTLLIGQQRMQEARECYTRCTRVLTSKGKDISPQLQALFEQASRVHQAYNLLDGKLSVSSPARVIQL